MRWYRVHRAVLLLWALQAWGQTLDNNALRGKYYFRQIWLATDPSGNVTDSRALTGTLNFDGAGNYSFTGQQVHATAAPSALADSGTYSMDPAGLVTLSDPLQKTQKLNARYSQLGLMASATETANRAFELLVAIPAPGTAGNASLNGSYWAGAIEFPGASARFLHNTFFRLQADGQGSFSSISVNGHAADNSSGAPVTQTVAGATYAISADGSGSATFGNGASLLNGNRNIYVSADGNLVLGGSPTGIDLLFAVKASAGVSNSSWTGRFFAAGLRSDDQGMNGYAGSLFANGQGNLTWSKRFLNSAFGAIDFTGATPYQLNSDGFGTNGLTQVALGAGGHAFVGAAVNPNAPNAFELYLGMSMPAVSGGGVFINPQGVLNAASSAPAGNPIAPGEYVAIYGTGFAGTTSSAAPPYPTSFAGVSVLVNNVPAPISFVSPGQINILVPYATAGPRAAIVVKSGANPSNSVTVPVAATAPGVFSQDGSGSGLGSILHTDYSLVTAGHPAHPGETILVYLTGLGAVAPKVADGAIPGASTIVGDVTVLIADVQATVPYAGMAPGFPGLYQLNVVVPNNVLVTGQVPLAVVTPFSTHDQVDLPVSAQ